MIPDLNSLLKACGSRTIEKAADTIAYARDCRCDKHGRWDSAEKRLEAMAHVLGPTVIEPEVAKAICAMQALGIPTKASCGGHPDTSKRPYIMLGVADTNPAYAIESEKLLGRGLILLGEVILPSDLALVNQGTTLRSRHHQHLETVADIQLAQSAFADLGNRLTEWFFTLDVCGCTRLDTNS